MLILQYFIFLIMQTGGYMTEPQVMPDFDVEPTGGGFAHFWPSALTLILGAVLGWLPRRRKDRADAKRVEVDVLEAAIQTLNRTVVDPLAERFNLLQDDYEKVIKELRLLKNAINKAYNCKHVAVCPVRVELQRQEKFTRPRNGGKHSTHRQREPCAADHAEAGNDSAENGDLDLDPG